MTLLPEFPWMTGLIAIAVSTAPIAARAGGADVLAIWLLAALMAGALAAPAPAVAFLAIALAGAVHAGLAWRWSRTGAVMHLTAAGLCAAAAAWAGTGRHGMALLCSLLAVGLRAGVPPLHSGAAALAERASGHLAQQWGSLLTLIFVHLRWVGATPIPPVALSVLVPLAAAAAVGSGLLALVQTDLRGLYRASATLHGSLVLCAILASTAHSSAAALLVGATSALSLGGLGTLIAAVEARSGPVRFDDPGGRALAWPILAAAFGVLTAAGVSIPGTAGFVADDLLLHGLWLVSRPATVAAVIAPALLAVASLSAYARTFLGQAPVRRIAPDLSVRERVAAAMLLLLLVSLGFLPALLSREAVRLDDVARDAPITTPDSR